MTQGRSQGVDLAPHLVDATMPLTGGAGPPPTRDTRVFIAEADSASAEMLRELLTSEGYTVHLAADLEDALSTLRAGHWEIALVSSFSASGQNPGAWATLRRLVAAAGATPVVLLTGHAFPEEDVRDLGLAGLLRKPYDVDLLLDTVAKISSRG